MILSNSSRRDSAPIVVDDPVDIICAFFFGRISSNVEEPTILLVSGLFRCRAWKAAVMGSLTLEALDNISEDENKSARVDGGPLMVVDESASALMYACLPEGRVCY